MTDHGVQFHRVPASACLEQAARLILDGAGNSLPDLSDVVVVLPQLFLAQPLSERLAQLARRALLLPRFVSFAGLAQSVPLDRPAMPHARRQALLHDALRSTAWFKAGSLWRAADDLLALIDELALHAPAAIAAGAAPAAGKQSKLSLGSGRLLDMEAQLVEYLALALDGDSANDGGALAPAAAYRVRLARFELSAPMFVVGIDTFNLIETQFLERCARAQPVHAIASALRFEDCARAALLASAWPEAAVTAENTALPALRERARTLADARAHSPARAWLRTHEASSLEAQAHAAVAQIQAWLAAGLTRIAIVAQDRLAARRVRALLERVDVLAQDEAGWRLSTTAASTVLARWLGLLDAQFAYREFMDFLSSPFVLTRGEQGEQQRVIAEVDLAARKENWTQGLPSLQRILADRRSSVTTAALARITAATVVFMGDAGAKSAAFAAGVARVAGRNTLPRWLELLERSLHLLGVDSALGADEAGQQLLARLADQRAQLEQHRARYSFAQFRDWMSHDLESAYFRDSSIDSPVVITALSNMNLREFDAVVVIGADEEHMFGAAPAGFLNERARAQLGLTTHAAHVRQQTRTLAEALLLAREVLFVWQSAADGAPRSPSPLIERLRALHALSYGGEDLSDPQLDALVAARAAPARTSNAECTVPAWVSGAARAAPAPRAPKELVPQRVSASAYQSLMSCPYQFHTLYVLGLRKDDEVREEMDKHDFGQFVHAVLHRFHTRYAHLQGVPRATAHAELLAIADAELAQWQRRSALNRAWRVRWEALAEDYLDWQAEREAQGWRWREGEIDRELELELANGGSVTLRGRIDRVDSRTEEGASEHALVDYKTSNASKLRKTTSKPTGEDVQLASYAALYGEPVARAEYLSLDKEKVAPVQVPDIAALADANLQRLRTLFDALNASAALPAQGLMAACEHCAARGLCRRDVWV